MSRLRIASGLAAACLLVGCATTPGSSAGMVAGDAGAPTPAPKPAPLPLPDAQLSAQTLYQLLVAEIAVQRGQLQVAADSYLRVAHRTKDPRIARRAARIAIYARDGARALDAAHLWATLAPEDPEGQQAVAALLVQDGRMEEALPHLQRLLVLAGEESGLRAVTTILARAEDKEQALKLFDRLNAGHPTPTVHYFSAKLALLAGKPQLALQRTNQLLIERPDWPKALVLKGTILQELGQTKQALAAFDTAVEAAPDNAQLRLAYARLLVDADQIDRARDQFRELARQVPDNPDITYALGLLALQAGDLDEAETHLKKLVDSGQHRNEAAYSLGQIAEQRGKPHTAMNWYSAVGHGEHYIDAQVRIAALLADTKGVPAARRSLQALHPTDTADQVKLLLAEGEILREHGRYHQAMDFYDRAVKRYPANPDLRYARAMVAEKLNRLSLLESDLRRILKTDPNNVQALNALGYTLADRTHRYKEAYGYISKALEGAPNDPAVLDSLGWVLYRMGRNDEALKYLRRAAEQLADPEIAAHLGEVLWASGDRQTARQVWNKARETHPDSDILQRTMGRFLGH